MLIYKQNDTISLANGFISIATRDRVSALLLHASLENRDAFVKNFATSNFHLISTSNNSLNKDGYGRKLLMKSNLCLVFSNLFHVSEWSYGINFKIEKETFPRATILNRNTRARRHRSHEWRKVPVASQCTRICYYRVTHACADA